MFFDLVCCLILYFCSSNMDSITLNFQINPSLKVKYIPSSSAMFAHKKTLNGDRMGLGLIVH